MLWTAGPTVAHLVEWGHERWYYDRPDRRPGWVSPCRYGVFVPTTSQELVRTLWRVEDLPTIPWCKSCTAWARRRVAVLVNTGIIAEVPIGTVPA